MSCIKYILVLMICFVWCFTCCSLQKRDIGLNTNSNSNNNTSLPHKGAQESNSEAFDFRKANWGMEREKVKATESTPPLVSDFEMIGYKVEVDRKDAYCMYGFVDDKLAVGMYQFKDLHANKNDYFEDFSKLKNILAEKYGNPKVDEVEWKRKTFKSKPEDWGLAVGIGDLIYRAKWETDRTDVLLILYGDNYDVTLMVRYDSKEYRPLFDEAAKKRGKSNF